MKIRILKMSVIFVALYLCVIILFCVKANVAIAVGKDANKEICVSGNFFTTYHKILALTEDNDSVKSVIYLLSADDILVDKQELFTDYTYIKYLVNTNLPFLTWTDWKFLMKNNAIATITGVLSLPIYMFSTPSYSKGESYYKGTVSPEYLYTMINYCKEKNIQIQPVVLPNPDKINTKDIDACVDLVQYYVGGMLDYSDMYVPAKYVKNKILTEEGKRLVMNAILSNIHGVHSKEYVELNKIENVCKDSPLLNLVKSSKKVVFVGNSITEGCNNGGYGWYESLMATYLNVQVGKVAYGGITTEGLSKRMKEIVDAKGDLYVIASGCNDIKVGIPESGAEEYIHYLQKIVDNVRKSNASVRFVFIAPWQRWPETEVEKVARPEYTKVLKKWCKSNHFVFVNPNPYLDGYVTKSKYSNYYMVDRTHPNSGHGMKLYSEAVVNCAIQY